MKILLELSIHLLCYLPLFLTAQDLGKIWIDDQHLYVNIPEEGILIFDNSDVYEPVEMGYLPIPECHEIAIADGILYANHYDDLITIDLQAYLADKGRSCKVINRISGVFPQYRSGGHRIEVCNVLPSSSALAASQGGSMSSIAFDNAENPDFLYIVQGNSIATFRVTERRGGIQKVGANLAVNDFVETILVEGNRLYIGAKSGLHIYSIQNRQKPVRVGRYNHIHGCDPVVVEDNIAYVTIHDGNRCGRTINELHIVDVSNASMPKLISSHSMRNPHGIGVDNKCLFLADGDAGLKVLNATIPSRLQSLTTDTKIRGAFDVIVMAALRRLILVAGNEVIQYTYNTSGQLTRLSEIQVEY